MVLSALAAARAARVRCEIISRACSATAAMMCSMKRLASGMSAATNSTPLYIEARQLVSAWFRICPFWVAQVAWKPPAGEGRILDTPLVVAGGG